MKTKTIGVWVEYDYGTGYGPIYFTQMKSLKSLPASERYILPNGMKMTKQNTERVVSGEFNDGEDSPYWVVGDHTYPVAVIWE